MRPTVPATPLQRIRSSRSTRSIRRWPRASPAVSIAGKSSMRRVADTRNSHSNASAIPPASPRTPSKSSPALLPRAISTQHGEKEDTEDTEENKKGRGNAGYCYDGSYCNHRNYLPFISVSCVFLRALCVLCASVLGVDSTNVFCGGRRGGSLALCGLVSR